MTAATAITDNGKEAADERPWTDPLLDSYLADLVEAERVGRNLVTEKYGRMMESTAPQDFHDNIEPYIPRLSDERIATQEHVIATQVAWAEDFRARYPKLGRAMRVLRTAEDTAQSTSFETYLRGELGTYSERPHRADAGIGALPAGPPARHRSICHSPWGVRALRAIFARDQMMAIRISAPPTTAHPMANITRGSISNHASTPLGNLTPNRIATAPTSSMNTPNVSVAALGPVLRMTGRTGTSRGTCT